MRYLLRRIAWALPILIGINLVTFALFFMVNKPENIAKMHLGPKYATEQDIQAWLKAKGYDKPLFYNTQSDNKFTDTLFVQKSARLFVFDFGPSDTGGDIFQDIKARYKPSLMIAVPTLILGLLINIQISLWLAYFRGSLLDKVGLVTAVLLISISALFYIIFGQFLFSLALRWFPVSGYMSGLSALYFVTLPILIGVVSGIGTGMRWYRALFVEEMEKDYVRVARAKGLKEELILRRHVLRNTLIPISTQIIVVLPTLFMGSLLMESFFGIPGLGSYTVDALFAQDFAIVRAMVYLGGFLTIVGLIATDLFYMIVDPRVRL